MTENDLSRRSFLRNSAGGSAALGSLSASPARALAAPADPPYPVTWCLDPSGPTPADPGRVNSFKLVTRTGFSAAFQHKLRAYAPGMDVKICSGADDFRREIVDAHVLLGDFSREDFSAARQLRWIQYNAAGVEEIMFPELVTSPVVLTNMQKMFSPTASQSVIGLILTLSRKLNQYALQTKEHRWNPLKGLSEISGLTLGTVGLGGMGTDAAYRAHYGFQMRILATDAKPLPKPVFVEELHSPDWLPQMVPQVDVLLSAAPHTPITHRMFNEAVFRAMKPTAYFINISRGWLVDEPALIRALNERWIAGAGLDVAYEEPLPADNPLWTAGHGNLIITSHTDANSEGSEQRGADLFCENVRRYVSGLPLLNVVDKKRGY
ncbi:MAG: D-2-hydroxyacid dehydrogenase [Terriglobia bacterium]